MPIHTVPGSWQETLRITTPATNRTGAALAAGDVVAFDLTGSDGDVDAYGTTKTDPFSNVIAVGATHDDGWLFGVALETIANDAQGEFLLRGVTDVEMVGSSAVVAGTRIAPTSGQTYVSAEGDGLAIVGIALEAGPTGTAAATGAAWFDGIASSAGPQAEVA